MSAAPSGSNPNQSAMDEPPPPYGWVKQWDTNTNHPFWVDTQANPPRSIWTHPYEDELYLKSHPEARRNNFQPPPGAPPETRRHSFHGPGSPRSTLGVPEKGPQPSRSHPSTPHPQDESRGLFGKLKDMTIGTKEEREQAKRQRAQMEAQRQQQIRQILEQRQRNYGSQSPFGTNARFVQQSPRIAYGAPPGNPYAYGGGPYGGHGGYGRRGGGMGLPLLGGLAGGMLLGSAMGGDGGDFGGDGGDFGGGDFGGGDFGGGF